MTENKRTDIDKFQKWLDTVPPERMKSLLVEAFWHNRLAHTELLRFYEIERAGICMDSILHRPRALVRRRKS